MSDDGIGVVLPDSNNATHDVTLTPLFFNRSGRGSATEYVSLWHGTQGFFWSQTSQAINRAYRMGFTLESLSTSALDALHRPYSLRCLVSTNNR